MSTQSPAYGPQPPTPEEHRQARIAPDLAKEAGRGLAERERLVLAMLDTEAAFRASEDRITVTAEHEIAATDPEAEPELLHDPDPEVGGWPGWSDRSMLAPEPELDAEAEAEAEAEWADNWDSADSHAYMDRVEAGLEPEAEQASIEACQAANAAAHPEPEPEPEPEAEP